MGGEGTVKIDWSRYNSILCKLGFDGSFRELICSHGFEPTFECESLVGLYLPYEKHPYGTEDLLSDLKPYVEPGSWFRWEYEDGAVEIEDFGNPELLAIFVQHLRLISSLLNGFCLRCPIRRVLLLE